MSEMLRADKVRQLVRDKGLKQNWVSEQIGLKKTAGHLMFRDGLLPKDDEVRNDVLKKLSKLLGVEVSEILLRLEARQKQTA